MKEQEPSPPSRYVPTLTEIVWPGAAAPAPHGHRAPPQAEAHAPQAAADRVLQQLGPELDQRIAEAVARLLHEQMRDFNARLRKTVESVVRDAVAQAVARGDGESGPEPGARR